MLFWENFAHLLFQYIKRHTCSVMCIEQWTAWSVVNLSLLTDGLIIYKHLQGTQCQQPLGH